MSAAIPGSLAGSYSQKKSNRPSTSRNVPGTVVLRDANGAFDGIASSVADNAITSAKIANDTIVDADIKSDAAISLSKLATGALPTGITVASANIVDGTIVNDDVNNNAAITGTKIAPNFGSQNVSTTGSLAASSFAVAGCNLQSWSSGSDIDNLLDGTTAGGLLQSPGNAHLVIGIRDNDNSDSFSIVSGGGNYMTDTTYDTLVANFKANGNVGIGRLPGVKLDVDGNARVTNTLSLSTAAGQFRFASFETSGSARWAVGASDAAETGSNAGTNFFINRYADNGSFIDTPFSIRRSTGNVGINTSNPSVKLQVSVSNEGDYAITAASPTGNINLVPDATNGHFIRYGGPGAASGIMRFLGPGDVERVRIDSSGRLGVGTNNPTRALQVGDGTALTVAYVRGDTSGYGAGLQIHNDNTGNSAAAFIDFGLGTDSVAASIHARKQSDGSTDLVCLPSGTNGATYDGINMDGSNGRVGIGTASPAERLHVSGGDLRLERVASTDGAVSFAAADTYIYGNTSNNAIAIGTDSTNRFFVSNNGVDWVGNLGVTSATTAAAATAGTSGAVPAQVAGYLVVSINGTSRKIPYYAT